MGHVLACPGPSARERLEAQVGAELARELFAVAGGPATDDEND
jgi:hypothetical protein